MNRADKIRRLADLTNHEGERAAALAALQRMKQDPAAPAPINFRDLRRVTADHSVTITFTVMVSDAEQFREQIRCKPRA